MAEIQNDPRFLKPDWLLERWTPTVTGVKRLLDLVFSIPLILVAIVTFPVLAIAIKLDSHGPVFYTQERVGQGGQGFSVIKYRSMVTDAERHGARFASRNDSRVTKTGAFLRKTRLDEVPQVINVLKGEMSLIGPRPERPHVVQQMTESVPEFGMRTVVKPGLTGWAQVHGAYAANESELSAKLEYDLYYIRNFSLKKDLEVLIKTALVVIDRRGL